MREPTKTSPKYWKRVRGSGGAVPLKNKDIGATDHYFIGGYYFYFYFFLTCYNYVIFYFGLIEKGLALLIIPIFYE